MERTISRRWNHWWFRQVPPHALALFRITFGLFLLLYWGRYAPHVPLLMGDAGIAFPLFLDRFPLLQTPSVPVAWGLYTLLLLAFLLIALGAWMRIAAGSALLLLAYIWVTSMHPHWLTMEHLTMVCLVLLSVSGADHALSLRMWRRHGSPLAWEHVSILPQRCIALQITATYLGVGWQKAWLPDWQSGEILAYSLVSVWGTVPAFTIAQANFPLWIYDLLVLQVKYVEFLLPFGLWTPRVRWFFMAWGLLFHGLIAIFLRIWWFLVLVPSYILFFEPEEVFRWCTSSPRGERTKVRGTPQKLSRRKNIHVDKRKSLAFFYRYAMSTRHGSIH